MQETITRTPSGAARTWLQRLDGVGIFLFGALVFGVACTQAPLYYSNQNQYCLHGLASAGLGYLDEDWLARTADPTPVFSALVAFTYRHLSETLFYVYFLILLGLYFHSLVGLFDFMTGDRSTVLARLGFMTLVVLVHAGLVRWGSVALFGVDYPWYFQSGVAGQYLLGFGLQPSVFGVLLLVSIHAFVRDRLWLAAVFAALAPILHATYLLGAALLVLAYLVVLSRAGRFRDALCVGLLALVVVLPVIVYHLVTFAPSSAGTFAEARQILTEVRIPHHAAVDRWFDLVALLQVAWIMAALYLVRGNPLFLVLGIPFVLAVLLTVVQFVTGSDALALLFPWRISAVLVPAATAVILGKLVRRLSPWLEGGARRLTLGMGVVCGLVLAALVMGGIAIQYLDLGYRTNADEGPLMEYVWAHKSRGDLYLIPVEVPRVGSGPRGSVSTSLTPPPAKGGHLIPVDFQRFRLHTGAPIFVDFKSIPYRDDEVLEWYERVLWNQQVYQERDWNKTGTLEAVKREGITHVVATRDRDIQCDGLEPLYENASYRVYRVR
jgi:hypothetical protein